MCFKGITLAVLVRTDCNGARAGVGQPLGGRRDGGRWGGGGWGKGVVGKWRQLYSNINLKNDLKKEEESY